MAADLAAGYCGEPTVEDFLKRVGEEYPNPRVKEGPRQLWLIDDLDNAQSPRAICRYAKRNLPRALSATRKRYAHVLANASETKRQNEAVADRQNENQDDSRSA